MLPIVNDMRRPERDTERLEFVTRMPEQLFPFAGMGVDDKHCLARDRSTLHPTQVVDTAENSSSA